MDIVFEDNNIMIINKEIGVLSYSENPDDDCLQKEVNDYLKNKAYLINRLDKDTSGLIMFAKTEKAAKYFSDVFSSHEKVEKTYLTLVSGKIDEKGEINAPIRKNFQLRKMVIAPISSGAKEAKTLYTPIKNFEDSTLLEVTLLTGRTHQIRVHMSYIKHHVIGDYKYGDFKINNIYKKEYDLKSQFLHSYRLKFNNLESAFSYLNEKVFEANLPSVFKTILDNKRI